MSDRPQALLDVQELMKALAEDNVSAMLDDDGVSTRDPAIRSQLTRIIGSIGFNLVFRIFDDNPSDNRPSLLSRQPEAVSLLDNANFESVTAILFASAVKIAAISKMVPASFVEVAKECFVTPITFSTLIVIATDALNEADSKCAGTSHDERLKAVFAETGNLLTGSFTHPKLMALKPNLNREQFADDLSTFIRTLVVESSTIVANAVATPDQSSPSQPPRTATPSSVNLPTSSSTTTQAPEGGGCGCVFWIVILIGLIYWWFR